MGMTPFFAVLGFAAAAYHFLGYPLLLIALAKMRGGARPDPGLPDAELPSVTMVIAAYNEEKVIAEKLRNSLSLDYPPGLFSVIVVADGSSDATAAVVNAMGDPRVTCLFEPERRGKSHALNRAVATATSDVLVLSDANNFYSPDSIRLLVARLGEPGVGGATGAKRIVASRERAASTGDGLYWKYESRLKTAESMLGGTVTADGEVFALRRELYTPIPAKVVNDDLYLSLRLVERGYQIVYEPRATAIEEASITILEDYRTKVRMIAGGLQNVSQDWRTISASRLYAWKFLSHKLLRWTMPVFLLMLLVSSGLSVELPVFALLFAGQLCFYALAGVGWAMNAAHRQSTLTYVPFYFVVMNMAAAAAIVRFFRGGQSTLWTKAGR